ncbi:MAG: hypothetical protein WA421_14005 [Nitrososphaeraceae archaeon]
MSSTIAISNSTREILKKLGHKGQTYDQLILDLVRFKHGSEGRNFASSGKENSRRIEVK